MDIFAPQRFYVLQIDGDYAKLVSEQGVEHLVARALLPLNIQEGDRLLYQQLSYEIITE